MDASNVSTLENETPALRGKKAEAFHRSFRVPDASTLNLSFRYFGPL